LSHSQTDLTRCTYEAHHLVLVAIKKAFNGLPPLFANFFQSSQIRPLGSQQATLRAKRKAPVVWGFI
jgi:hypothetical protein